MKRIWMTIVCLLLLGCLCMVSCQKGEEEYTAPVYYTVSFQTGGGTEIDPVRISAGSKLREPEIPEKDGYLFGGWAEGVKLWDFGSDTVKGDTTLVARWVDAKTAFDYETDETDETVTITGYHGNPKQVVIPAAIDGFSVVAVADRAFADMDKEKIETVVLGESIRTVGVEAFAGCTDVEICIRGGLTQIGERAFLDCNGLYELVLREGLDVIPAEAFSGCTGMEELVLPESLTQIGENAFEGCTALETVMLSGQLATVEDSAFLRCDALVAVYHRGTPEQWEATEIHAGNNGNVALTEAEIYYYAAQKPVDGGDVAYWYYNEKGDIRVW